MVAPLSDVPQEGSSVFSLFSLIKLHLASLPLDCGCFISILGTKYIFFGPNAWGPVNHHVGTPKQKQGITQTTCRYTIFLGYGAVIIWYRKEKAENEAVCCYFDKRSIQVVIDDVEDLKFATCPLKVIPGIHFKDRCSKV